MVVASREFPEAMRSLKVAHQKERLIARSLMPSKPAQRDIHNNVAGVTLMDPTPFVMIFPRLALFLQQRVDIKPLTGEYIIIVKTLRFGMQMPFSNNSRFVTGLLHLNGNIRFVIAVPVIDEGIHTVFMGILTAKYRSAAWRADRVRAETVLEHHALCGDAVDIGGGAYFLEITAVRRDSLIGMIVRHYEQYIRFLALLLASGKRCARSNDGPGNTSNRRHP